MCRLRSNCWSGKWASQKVDFDGDHCWVVMIYHKRHLFQNMYLYLDLKVSLGAFLWVLWPSGSQFLRLGSMILDFSGSLPKDNAQKCTKLYIPG